MRNTSILLTIAAALLLAGPGNAQQAHAPLAPLSMTAVAGPRVFRTQHEAVFNGRKVHYDATVAESIVEDTGHAPAADIFTISYVARKGENVPGPAGERPVMFIFNGGPGASSAPLHLSLGPMRLQTVSTAEMANPQASLVTNPLCPLDVADLVFIDPTDTGFSHTYPGTSPQQLHSVDGDSDSITQVILQWLRANRRLSSPVYVYGESYGSMRAVALARDLARAAQKIQVAGLILGGEAITYGAGGRLFDPVRAAVSLQMMASVAWHYGKIDNKHQTRRQAVDEARQYGLTEYLHALIQGYALDTATRQRVMARLPGLIGIPESYFQKRQTIRISAKDFEAELLRDRGLYINDNDGLETSSKKPPASDETTDWTAAFVGLTNAMARYTKTDLGVRNLGPYEVLTPNLMKVFDEWSFSTSGAPDLSVTLAQTMKSDPRMRVLVMQGRYDTLTQIGVTQYTMDQTDIPRSRLTIAYFDGGHFLIPTAEAMAAIHHFVSGPSP